MSRRETVRCGLRLSRQRPRRSNASLVRASPSCGARCRAHPQPGSLRASSREQAAGCRRFRRDAAPSSPRRRHPDRGAVGPRGRERRLVQSSPAFAPSPERLYVGRDDGSVQQLDLGGTPQGVMNIDAATTVGDPVVDAEGSAFRLVAATAGTSGGRDGWRCSTCHSVTKRGTRRNQPCVGKGQHIDGDSLTLALQRDRVHHGRLTGGRVPADIDHGARERAPCSLTVPYAAKPACDSPRDGCKCPRR